MGKKTKEQPKTITIEQEKALVQVFTNFCDQYQQMGKMLTTMAVLLNPIFSGKQKITPQISFTPNDGLTPEQQIILLEKAVAESK